MAIHSGKLSAFQHKTGNCMPRVRIFSDMPLQYYGGGEKVIIELSNYIHSKGIEVDVLQGNSHVETRMSLEEIMRVTSAKIIVSGYEIYAPKFLYQEMPNVKEFIMEGVNLMFLYRIPPKRYLRKLRKIDARVIFCIHGITVVIPPLSLKLFLFSLYTKFALNYYSKFIQGKSEIMAQVLSKSTEEFLYSRGADKNHVIRITNGVDFSNFTVGKNNDQFMVIFMGRILNIQKGIDRLRDVVSKLPAEVKVLVIGSGPDSNLLKSTQGRNTEYLGFITEEEKFKKLRDANLLILPSNLEPFPLVILEGLASGLPCVATPVEGALEVLNQDQIFGTLSSFEADQITRDTVRYIDEWRMDKELYYQNKIRRREAAKKYYDLPIMMAKYYDMIMRSQ